MRHCDFGRSKRMKILGKNTIALVVPLLIVGSIPLAAVGFTPLAGATPNYVVTAGFDTLDTTSAGIGVSLNGDDHIIVPLEGGPGGGDTVIHRLVDVIGVPGLGIAAVGATPLAFTHLCLRTGRES